MCVCLTHLLSPPSLLHATHGGRAQDDRYGGEFFPLFNVLFVFNGLTPTVLKELNTLLKFGFLGVSQGRCVTVDESHLLNRITVSHGESPHPSIR